jgi:phenol 2-monooxygenase
MTKTCKRCTAGQPRCIRVPSRCLIQLVEEIDAGRNSVTLKDGRRVTTRGWHTMFEAMHGTYLDYCLNIRQKYSEEVIRQSYQKLGVEPYIGWKLESFSLDHESEDEYKVTSHVRNSKTDQLLVVKW